MVPLRRLVALIVIARVRFNVQLVMAVLLCVAGLTLVFCGFWVAPSGEIDNRVLVAFGEICTFAGALFGVVYSYKLKSFLSVTPSLLTEIRKLPKSPSLRYAPPEAP